MVGHAHGAAEDAALRAAEGKDGCLEGEATDNTRLWTNVVPKKMTIESMRSGYQQLYGRLLSDRGVADRIRSKMRHLVPSGANVGYSLVDQLKMAARLMLRGIAPGGVRRWWHFSRSLAYATPRQLRSSSPTGSPVSR